MQEILSIYGCITRSREGGQQTHLPTAERAKVKRLAHFPRFSRLPGEIRNLIWEFAAVAAITQPKYVSVLVENNEIRMDYTRTQSLPLVCKDSFAIYFENYFRHNHDSLAYGESDAHLAVNFECDIFHLGNLMISYEKMFSASRGLLYIIHPLKPLIRCQIRLPYQFPRPHIFS